MCERNYGGGYADIMTPARLTGSKTAHYSRNVSSSGNLIQSVCREQIQNLICVCMLHRLVNLNMLSSVQSQVCCCLIMWPISVDESFGCSVKMSESLCTVQYVFCLKTT